MLVHRVRRDENDQFGLVVLEAARPEQRAQHRDVAEEGNLVDRGVDVAAEQAAEHDGAAFHDVEFSLGLARAQRWTGCAHHREVEVADLAHDAGANDTVVVDPGRDLEAYAVRLELDCGAVDVAYAVRELATCQEARFGAAAGGQDGLGKDAGRAILLHEAELSVKPGVDRREEVEAGPERHGATRAVRVHDRRAVLRARADVDLQRGVPAPAGHPDAADGCAAGSIPGEPDLAQHVDREFGDLHFHDDHLFPADRVGEIEDLRVVLGERLDAGLVPIAQVVAFDDDLVADHGAVRVGNAGEKGRDLPIDAWGLGRNDGDFQSAVATVCAPYVER